LYYDVSYNRTQVNDAIKELGYFESLKQLSIITIYKQLKDKCVKTLKGSTEPPFGGLFFYFEYIEGNILEIAYSTFIPRDEENNAIDHHSIDEL